MKHIETMGLNGDKEQFKRPNRPLADFSDLSGDDELTTFYEREVLATPPLTPAVTNQLFEIRDIGIRAKEKLDTLNLSSDKQKLQVAQDQINQAEQARDKLLLANFRLVWFSAKKHKNKGVEFIDLLSEGDLILIHAVDHFQPKKGNQFSTYAVSCINRYLERYISEKAHLIQQSFRARQNFFLLKDTEKEFIEARSRKPTLAELVSSLREKRRKMPVQRADFLLNSGRQFLYLDAPIGGDLTNTGHSQVEDPVSRFRDSFDQDQFDRVTINEVNDYLTRLALEFDPDGIITRSLDVFTSYIGLNGEEKVTFRELGARHNISDTQARTVYRSLLLDLKQHLKERGFEENL